MDIVIIFVDFRLFVFFTLDFVFPIHKPAYVLCVGLLDDNQIVTGR